MAEEVTISVLEKFASMLVDPILSQFGYLFQYRRNIENLKDELNGLQASRQGVKIQIEEAEYNLEIVDPAMKSWAIRVAEVETRATKIIEKTTNFDDECLNFVKLHYLLSKNATKITRSICKLKVEGEKYAMSTHSSPPQGIITTIDALLPELTTRIDYTPSIQSNFEDLESRKLVFKHAMDALEDDRIRMIGISGAEGVGKTVFVNEVCRKAKEMGLFEQFAMTAVSQKQELIMIQDELAEMLGLKFIEEKSVLARANRLRSRLTNGRKILVILDDVWQEIPLKQVGIPVVGDRGRCKVLLTSRDKHVLSKMRTQLNLSVEALNDQESWKLFEDNVGGKIEKQNIPKQIFDHCKGIPFAIVTLAKALGEEESTAVDWAKVSISNCTQSLLNEKQETKIKGTKRKVSQEYEVIENEKKKRRIQIVDFLKPLPVCEQPPVKKQKRKRPVQRFESSRKLLRLQFASSVC